MSFMKIAQKHKNKIGFYYMKYFILDVQYISSSVFYNKKKQLKTNKYLYEFCHNNYNMEVTRIKTKDRINKKH